MRITKVGYYERFLRPSPRQIGRDQYALLRDVNLNEVVAVRMTEIVEIQRLSAELSVSWTSRGLPSSGACAATV